MLRTLAFATFVLALAPTPLAAQQRITIDGMAYSGPIIVIDGDTIDAGGERWRLIGYDTPETVHARCEHEADLGRTATRRLRHLIDKATEVTIVGHHGRLDRYKRRLGSLVVNSTQAGDILIAEGLAKPYTGRGPRPDWCPGVRRPATVVARRPATVSGESGAPPSTGVDLFSPNWGR